MKRQLLIVFLGLLCVAFATLRGAAQTIVTVDETQTFQTMDGFGASLTDSSAWLLSKTLKPAQRAQLLKDLFDPNEGIGLSYLRQPMGSSDFRTRDYTYDDVPDGESDYKLEKFSIAKDKEYILPILKEILALNPNLSVMATPWMAPKWMQDGKAHLKADDAVYSAYADYFVRFVQAYSAEGVPIAAITLQNEPQNIQASYPTMGMEPKEQIRLAILVGQRFRTAGIKTKIIAFDHNWEHPEYPIQVLSDPVASSYIDGVAWHGYGGEVGVQSRVHTLFPEKNVYFTECSGGDWAKDFGNNLMWDMENLVAGAPRNWAKTVVKWNLALDEKNGPKIAGGADNCRGVVTIRQDTGEATREVEYYVLGHASKFVQPGAKRVYSSAKNSVAYLNPNGAIALLLYNKELEPRTLRVQWRTRSFEVALPAQSVETLVWAQNASEAEAWLTTGDRKQLMKKQENARF